MAAPRIADLAAFWGALFALGIGAYAQYPPPLSPRPMGSMRELARQVAADFVERAAIAERDGRVMDAEVLYFRALEADSGCLIAYMGYARLLSGRGHVIEAQHLLATVPLRAFESDEDLFQLARLRATLGDADGALELLETQATSLEAARLRAEIATNAGRFPEALVAARRFAELARGSNQERSATLLVRALAMLVGDADAVRTVGPQAAVLRRLLAR